VNIEHYKKTTGYMKGVEAIQKMLDGLLLNRKGHGSEQANLRKAYLQPKWAHTNAKYREFVRGLFEKALDGDAALDASWPDFDRFSDGMDKIKKAGKGGVVHGLAVWVKAQKKLRGGGGD
jgi:hypothetical protein